ncbi:MAG: hypothetical protein ABIO70_37230 [Pseudomonadota bacterium]
MNPVEPAATWTTAWPAALALVGLVVGLVQARRALAPPRGWVAPALAFAILALAVRFLWLPALPEHAFDGHEADYLDLFLGSRAPTRGGTVLYPAMQWLYWGLGRVLTGPGWLLVVSGGVALVSIAAAAGLAWQLFGGRAAAWTAALLALYGNHAFWSSSAYNVMIPLALTLVSLWALVVAGRGGGWGLSLVAASAASLAVATRLESLVAALPALLLVIWRPPRPLKVHLPLLLGGAALAVAAVLPLIFPGGLPGEGEGRFMWPVNVGLRDYLAPWAGPWLPVLVALALLAPPAPGNRLRARAISRVPVLILLAWALAVHLVMAAFDDAAFRHWLPAGVALALVTGAALGALRPWPAGLCGATLITLLALDTGRIAGLYYAPEERFAAALPAALPRLDARERPPCTLVSEDDRVAQEQQLSHFNLLDPAESERLRGAGGGCLQWCPDLQDWRWSSRGVRARALRILHLYPATAVAVLTDEESGYACLLLELGGAARAGGGLADAGGVVALRATPVHTTGSASAAASRAGWAWPGTHPCRTPSPGRGARG